MSPTQDDSDWSDSDDDVSDVETSVLLGIPDGPILKQEDVEDAAVSRLAGYPVRYSTPYTVACTLIIIDLCHFYYCLPLTIRRLYQHLSLVYRVHNARIVLYLWNC